MQIAGIGFRAKTARAIAIALANGTSGPSYVSRWEIPLHDPAVPATSQPHHEVMELSWDKAKSAVRPIEGRIEEIATDTLAKLTNELRSRNVLIRTVGIVGSPDRNLERIGNPHIRAHAAEGILFRKVLETAAGNHGLLWRSFSDRSFDEFAVAELGRPSPEITAVLTAIGHAAGKPWRVDERLAATAAWISFKALAKH